MKRTTHNKSPICICGFTRVQVMSDPVALFIGARIT